MDRPSESRDVVGPTEGQRGRRLRLPGLRAPRLSLVPRTFQARLAFAFVMVFAVAAASASAVTIFALDRNLRQQEELDLDARATALSKVVAAQAETAAGGNVANQIVVSAADGLNPAVLAIVGDKATLSEYANKVAQADVQLRFGIETPVGYELVFTPARGTSTFAAEMTTPPGRGQARDDISYTAMFRFGSPEGVESPWYLEITLSSPYTTRQETITTVVGFVLFASAASLLMAVVFSMLLARRFTNPLRQLTDTARALAEGDLARRVPASPGGTVNEIAQLSRQFNAMADRVEETMEVIRRDRDTSREFLADVSHELRTPLAALRTFNELLQEKAGSDAAARTEFLEASGQQIERLDWLAQNLLELSKLDSGLVSLDLRPEDLGVTVRSSVEQAQVAAHRRGVDLSVELPDRPLVVRHDPQRMGQVLGNLIGNALKFTPRGGSVRVSVSAYPRGARIRVIDTGMGIDPAELPRIFDRFFRGSRSSEARSSGSGLGLAIARSVVEMHAGRITVESKIGAGSTFTVTLPANPSHFTNDSGPAAEGSHGGKGAAAEPTGSTATPAPTRTAAGVTRSRRRRFPRPALNVRRRSAAGKRAD